MALKITAVNPIPRLAALAALSVIVSGCASPYRTALSTPTDSLGNTSGIVATEQQEIGTSIRPSTGGGLFVGGLVGALVDSAANATSAGRMETAVAQVRQSLLDYDFSLACSRAVENAFAPESVLPFSSTVVVRDRSEKQLAEIVKEARGDAVMVVIVHHRLDPDFTHVIVSAEAFLCARSEQLRQYAVTQSYGGSSVAVLYRNGFQSSWTVPDGVMGGVGRDTMAPIWAADKGHAAREALDRGADEIAAMLAWDLAQPAAKDYRPARGEGRMVQVYPNGSAFAVMGASARTEDSRTWLRLADGRIAAQ